MLLQNKDGIACDTCGRAYRDKFTYYSFESEKITVDAQNRRTDQCGEDLNIDVCETCYNNAVDKVKKNLAPKPIRNTVKCDFCITLLRGAFTYHRLLIHKVMADRKQEEKGPASVEKKFMDFNLDDKCFKELANLATETRQGVKSKGEWS
jgi:hypothetical protein